MSDTPFGGGSGGGFGATSGSDLGTGTSSSGGTGFGTGSTGSSSMGSSTGSSMGTSGATEVCAHCGQSLKSGGGLEQFLGKLGITEEMIGNLKGQFQNVDIDEYMNTARDYLKDGSTKATTYAKDNPGKVAAGVAALALGAGLLYAAVNRDRS